MIDTHHMQCTQRICPLWLHLTIRRENFADEGHCILTIFSQEGVIGIVHPHTVPVNVFRLKIVPQPKWNHCTTLHKFYCVVFIHITSSNPGMVHTILLHHSCHIGQFLQQKVGKTTYCFKKYWAQSIEVEPITNQSRLPLVFRKKKTKTVHSYMEGTHVSQIGCIGCFTVNKTMKHLPLYCLVQPDGHQVSVIDIPALLFPKILLHQMQWSSLLPFVWKDHHNPQMEPQVSPIFLLVHFHLWPRCLCLIFGFGLWFCLLDLNWTWTKNGGSCFQFLLITTAEHISSVHWYKQSKGFVSLSTLLKSKVTTLFSSAAVKASDLMWAVVTTHKFTRNKQPKKIIVILLKPELAAVPEVRRARWKKRRTAPNFPTFNEWSEKQSSKKHQFVNVHASAFREHIFAMKSFMTVTLFNKWERNGTFILRFTHWHFLVISDVLLFLCEKLKQKKKFGSIRRRIAKANDIALNATTTEGWCVVVAHQLSAKHHLAVMPFQHTHFYSVTFWTCLFLFTCLGSSFLYQSWRRKIRLNELQLVSNQIIWSWLDKLRKKTLIGWKVSLFPTWGLEPPQQRDICPSACCSK